MSMINNLYNRIKLYHIQQDRRGGCSMASYLMVQNSILRQNKTQQQFREMVNSYDTWWTHRVEVKLGTIDIGKFFKYTKDALSRFCPGYICEKIRIRGISQETFSNILFTVNCSVDSYIIFNFDRHYSPLGSYNVRIASNNKESWSANSLTILDVDYSQKYDNEFIYDLDNGELDFSVKDFYSKLKKQNRSFLLIKKKVSNES